VPHRSKNENGISYRRELLMMPIGPLMIEHRLIERMIAVLEKETRRIEREKNVDSVFIDSAVDFIRTYADRCHHGKEEDILFRELKGKSLSKDHQRIMDELITEHQWGRNITGRLVDANIRYLKGGEDALPTVRDCLRSLTEFYPKHIEKEDKHFFIPIMEYFSNEEKDAMLNEGYEFDRNLIHAKYQDVVVRAEKVFGLNSA